MIVIVLLYYLLEALKWLIIIRAVLSWFVSPYSDHPVVRIIQRVTDPILRPLRDIIPPLGGVDISPLVAFFAVHMTQVLLLRL